MSLHYLNELNDEQKEAVEHTGSPLLILAGAGSGKTKTLTYKASYTIDKKMAPKDGILLVTFTNKAAGAMKERVREVTGEELPHVGTFHSIASRMLRKDGSKVGLDPGYVIYDQQDQKQLVKQVLDELDVDTKRFKPYSILTGISGAKQEMMSPESYQRIAKGPFQEVVSEAYKLYQKKMRKFGGVDFDDLLFYVVKLLVENENTRAKYQDLFSYVFVDEYQDTNAVQYAFTKLLTSHGRLVVVGDASQSIYRWRGADYKNIVKLKKDYPDIKEVRLERNYRSTQNILDAADQVIANNTTHPVLSLWTDQGQGEKIGLIEAYSGSDEATRIVDSMNKLRVQNGYSWSDFALLYRTNAQSRAIEEIFIRQGIPYILVGGVKFYERAEVKDVLSYLRLVYNPEDGISRERAEKIGKRRLSSLTQAFDGYDLKKHNVREVLELILESTSYLDKYDEDVEEELVRIENVRELESLAYEFEDLGEFLEHVALVQAEYFQGEIGKEGDAVTLMTLHAAKGLEFPVVYMIGMEEGLFPHSRSMLEKEELEEERRLCYVGITRAKERLFMSYAKKRVIWGSQTQNVRSRFIDEVDSSLFDQYGVLKKEGVTSKSGIRLDSLSDKTLEAFLDGDISVEELLDR